MQDKIIITFLSRNTNNTIEVDLNGISNNKVLFSFTEYEDVSIRLESKIYSVKLECLSYLDSEEKYNSTDDNLLFLQDGKEYVISKNNNLDIGYRPETYHIIVSDSLKEYDCLFRVDYNQQISNDGMNNIIESINQFINGLTIDFFKSQPINGISSSTDNSDFYIYELLYKYHSRLSLTCDKIINDLKMNVSSKIVGGSFAQKQNLASIRKNLTKPGDIVYNVKKVQSANNINNIILKKYLIKTLAIIEKCKLDLIPIISSKDLEISELLNLIEREKENLEKKNAHFNVMMIENHIKSLQADVNSLIKWKNKLLKWSKAYDNVCFSLRKVLAINEIKTLDVNNQISYSADFNLNYDYKFIADFYSLISSGSFAIQKRNSIGLFSNKKSYEIFEIYGFIILQNIIKELGFEFVGQEKTTIFDFCSGAEFNYSLNNKRIVIKYDYYCDKYINSKEDSVVNINSKNCKPDYLLLFYEDNILKNIVVAEMKYRNLKYLVEYDGGSTETDITLEDYFQLGYLRQKNRRPENIVRNVLLLYPSKGEQCFERNLANYIGINPEVSFNLSESYKTIKDLIETNM